MATVSCHLRPGTPSRCGARVRGQSDSVVPRTAASGEISSCDHTTWNIQLGQPSVNPSGLVLEAGGTST